jgi:uroporphyrinogen-III decarboxylase
MASMTARERIDTAVALGKPDRVPVAPMMDVFAARYAGITQHQLFFDIEKADRAFLKVHEELGPIDGFNFSNAGSGRLVMALSIVMPVIPGVNGVDENALWQFVEKTVMGPEEYPALAAGPDGFMRDKAIALREDIKGPLAFYRNKLLGQLDFLKVLIRARAWRRRGIEPMVAANFILFPLEQISTQLRSYSDFVTDLYRHPEELKAAARAMLRTWFPRCLVGPRISGVRRVFIGLTRTSASLFSPRQFEEFALPDLKETCEYLVRHRLTPLLHLDNDWTPFFPYFRELPAGKCILNLDGTSDIFAAKQVLGDHMCIMGDVPATLLKLGTVEEVEGYCERLIREVGADGGFILSSGCDIPIDAKPENVRAMLQSVRKFLP